MRRRHGFNPKRRIAPAGMDAVSDLEELALRARYGGNPEHKRTPADYGLTPPSRPRKGKTLCDGNGPFAKDAAMQLLKSGIAKGLISLARSGEWPQNVWAVSVSGEAFEAQLENSEQGIYHGYPMPAADRFRVLVIEEWNRR